MVRKVLESKYSGETLLGMIGGMSGEDLKRKYVLHQDILTLLIIAICNRR